MPTPATCCALGFQAVQPGVADPSGILVSAGHPFFPQINDPFGPDIADITALSHEITELHNDPCANTKVAPWVDGGVSFAHGNLETSDVIEEMNSTDSIFKVPLGGYTYHLQNAALLAWFTRNPLYGGLYSWPNIHTLGQCAHVLALSSWPNWCYGEGSAGFYFGPPY
jgi:hypothetical protein